MRFFRPFAVILLGLVAGCGGIDTQIPLPEASTSLRLRPLVSSIEVRDMSLPRYADADEIVLLNEDGGLETLSGNLWADTPSRASTYALADALGTITGARVAAEPWPFTDSPAAQVQVRVSQMHGDASGVFRLKGQYAISPVASGLADRSGQFDITTPLTGDTPHAVAQAQSRAITELAETIARRIAR
ncbi:MULTISPECIES: PqiC family protein [unclassified Meridianimarinicoccus]|uniref:PqiC family protein n=1 Tax=unclassified Meridianimarinicoccus TaxID=2923344 RepID=UPI001868BA15|nr:PqiC family protein [Fluviibacterium sp. MJW13]